MVKSHPSRSLLHVCADTCGKGHWPARGILSRRTFGVLTVLHDCRQATHPGDRLTRLKERHSSPCYEHRGIQFGFLLQVTEEPYFINMVVKSSDKTELSPTVVILIVSTRENQDLFTPKKKTSNFFIAYKPIWIFIFHNTHTHTHTHRH